MTDTDVYRGCEYVQTTLCEVGDCITLASPHLEEKTMFKVHLSHNESIRNLYQQRPTRIPDQLPPEEYVNKEWANIKDTIKTIENEVLGNRSKNQSLKSTENTARQDKRSYRAVKRKVQRTYS